MAAASPPAGWGGLRYPTIIGLCLFAGYMALTASHRGSFPGTHTRPPPEWREFAPAGAAFVVSMPGVPNKMEAPGGKAFPPNTSALDFLLDAPEVGLALSISEARFGRGVGVAPLAVMARQEAERLADAGGGRIVHEAEVVRGGLAGREYHVDVKNGRLVGRMFAAAVDEGWRVWILSAYGFKERVASPDAIRFLDSFRVRPAG